MTNYIFVGGISYNYNESDLEKLFSLAGPVEKINIKKDGKTIKGFGFIHYKDNEIAETALRNKNNFFYNGKQLTINYPSECKENILLPEDNLVKNDIKYIKDIPDNNSTNKVNNFENLLLNLSDQQKILLLYSMKTLDQKQNNENFTKLLYNQSEATLKAVISLQEDIINRYKD